MNIIKISCRIEPKAAFLIVCIFCCVNFFYMLKQKNNYVDKIVQVLDKLIGV